MVIKSEYECRECHKLLTSCARCETDGVCDCSPCECEYCDPSPAARAAMARYDAAMERRERRPDSHEED